mmetsp:Transcript_38301/g.92069  ORF Transcript_38301/g.92069 Transcript_38301/m.92069 type:complete len:207 (-) Transcript_38301:298-918(-)
MCCPASSILHIWVRPSTFTATARKGAVASPSIMMITQLRKGCGMGELSPSTAAPLTTAIKGTERSIPVGPQTQPRATIQNMHTTGCIFMISSDSTIMTSITLPNKNLRATIPITVTTTHIAQSSRALSSNKMGTGINKPTNAPISGIKASIAVSNPKVQARSRPMTQSQNPEQNPKRQQAADLIKTYLRITLSKLATLIGEDIQNT